jgi:mannose-6-phosphate isomerase-like protein (cupin superfamily)
VHVGDTTFGRGVFEPGWRWSQDVKPIAGTDSCQAHHTLYILSGRMTIAMNDGTELELKPGDAAVIAPGHDAWTVGEEACVAIDNTGVARYAKRD